MQIPLKQFCEILEVEGIPIVERYRILFALKEHDFYELVPSGAPKIKQSPTLSAQDVEDMMVYAQAYAQTGYVSRRISAGELMEPEVLHNI